VTRLCRIPILITILLSTIAGASVSESREAGGTREREARYYRKLDGGAVQCVLCPNFCSIGEGGRGICRVRRNRGGALYTLVYGAPCAVHVDPIEKKPFFHVLPGTRSYSISTVGCNMRCVFCQNWQISQAAPEESVSYDLPPEKVVEGALQNDCATIAFTYTEPTVFYEYMLDIAKLAKEEGVKCVMHSCGYINPDPLRELCRYLVAVDIDLKGFSEEFYRKLGQGHLAPVLETLKVLKEEGVWIEITNLLIPGENDEPALIRSMCKWIKDNLGDEVPLHFSRFYPAYKLQNLPPTPIETVERSRKIALEMGLKYVYVGNIPGHPGESTFCPNCKKMVLQRLGYTVMSNNIVKGKCKFCGYEIKGVWSNK
jgi:pyruvate formate lyase activating enzyme